jgi:hypothetical protein
LNHLEIRKSLNDFAKSVAGKSPIRVSLNTSVQIQTSFFDNFDLSYQARKRPTFVARCPPDCQADLWSAFHLAGELWSEPAYN